MTDIRTSTDRRTGFAHEPPEVAAVCRHGNRVGLLLPWKEMSMAGDDITIEILKDIRDDIRGVRSEVHELRTEVQDVRTEVHDLRTDTNKRSALVEAAILDLAEHHRFVVRYAKTIADRDGQLEPRVSALESRVDKLESK
ncbi:MAG TPA: hypothetical protein VKQ32_10020 [Polyangia bacterium]|nr:hypothetical protein [Polyangia bacterium]